MLIDTHCHLDAPEFLSDRELVLGKARKAGVTALLIPAVGLANFAAVRDCCVRYAECFPAYGFHPLFLAQRKPQDIAVLRAYLRHELSGTVPPLAVGEIGLDFYVPAFDAAHQEYFLLEQLKIAREFDLPVVLHVRKAIDLVLKLVRQIGVRKGIAHAFNGSPQQAEMLLNQGFKLGFGGAMTYPGSTRIRQLATHLPLEAIVLETDAPDIAPIWKRGERNTPADLRPIALTLAKLRGLDLPTILAASSANALAVLPALRNSTA